VTVRSGVGGTSEGAVDWRATRLVRAARASFTLRRFGAAFVGDCGSPATLLDGLKRPDCSGAASGSVVAFVLLDGSLFLVDDSEAAVFRRGDAFAAGAKASSSSFCRRSAGCSSPSSWSGTSFSLGAAVLRVATRRDDRIGNSEGMTVIGVVALPVLDRNALHLNTTVFGNVDTSVNIARGIHGHSGANHLAAREHVTSTQGPPSWWSCTIFMKA
jgi:hypothetical protein